MCGSRTPSRFRLAPFQVITTDAHGRSPWCRSKPARCPARHTEGVRRPVSSRTETLAADSSSDAWSTAERPLHSITHSSGTGRCGIRALRCQLGVAGPQGSTVGPPPSTMSGGYRRRVPDDATTPAPDPGTSSPTPTRCPKRVARRARSASGSGGFRIEAMLARRCPRSPVPNSTTSTPGSWRAKR